MLVSDLAASVLVTSEGYASFFHWLGAVPIPFLCLFAYVFRNSPTKHSTLTQSELTYIRANAIVADKHSMTSCSLALPLCICPSLSLCHEVYCFSNAPSLSVYLSINPAIYLSLSISVYLSLVEITGLPTRC